MNDECYMAKLKMLLWPRLSRSEIRSIISDLNSERGANRLFDIYGSPLHFSKTLKASEKKSICMYIRFFFLICIIPLFVLLIRYLSGYSFTISSLGVALFSWMIYAVLSDDVFISKIRRVSLEEKKRFWIVFVFETILEICSLFFCSVYSLTYRRNILFFSGLLICVLAVSLWFYIAKQEQWMIGISIRSIDMIIMFGLGRKIYGAMSEIYDVGTWILGMVAGIIISFLLYMLYLKGCKIYGRSA